MVDRRCWATRRCCAVAGPHPAAPPTGQRMTGVQWRWHAALLASLVRTPTRPAQLPRLCRAISSRRLAEPLHVPTAAATATPRCCRPCLAFWTAATWQPTRSAPTPRGGWDTRSAWVLTPHALRAPRPRYRPATVFITARVNALRCSSASRAAASWLGTRLARQQGAGLLMGAGPGRQSAASGAR